MLVAETTASQDARISEVVERESARLRHFIARQVEAAYARTLLIEELQAALKELTSEQRAAFIAHEIEGRDFKDIAAGTGVTVNALILRKRQAVLHLRRRLKGLHNYFSKT